MSGISLIKNIRLTEKELQTLLNGGEVCVHGSIKDESGFLTLKFEGDGQ